MSKSSCKRIEVIAEGRGEFTTMEDGYVYWFPSANGGGCSSAVLRDLADILDRRNQVWDEQVQREIGKEQHDQRRFS